MPDRRADHIGQHRTVFEKNRKIILQREDICGICGQPVDKSYKYPHPLSPTVDHIVPIDRGGHPSDIANLQLAHMACNRKKSNKISREKIKENDDEILTMRNLPQSMDWREYRYK